MNVDERSIFFSTLSLDELYQLILTDQRDVVRAMGFPLSIKVAPKFTKNLIVSHVDGAMQNFKTGSLDIGLATLFQQARVYLQICGKSFSRVVLDKVGKVER